MATLNSDGPMKLLYIAETHLEIIVHCSDFVKRAQPVFFLAQYLFYLWKNTIVYLGNKEIANWKWCYLSYEVFIWAAQTHCYWTSFSSRCPASRAGAGRWWVETWRWSLNALTAPALCPMPSHGMPSTFIRYLKLAMVMEIKYSGHIEETLTIWISWLIG